jgi:tetratricopeptide (TPR) repeat protein
MLSELRRLRRSSEVAAYFALAVLVLAGGYIYWRVRQPLQRSRLAQGIEQAQQEERTRQAQRPRPSAQAAQSRPWAEVSEAMDRVDYPKAISLLQGLIARQPSYYYGYAYLGNVYVAMGDFTNAEAQYLRACELFPDDENEKTLAVIRKRLARERGLPSPSK